MKGRIIFVGIHNKPGYTPLDSRTKSGKIIDEVIAGLPGRECVKTNLFDTDKLPEQKYMGEWVLDWIERVRLHHTDTVVLLGDIVQREFPSLPVRIIKAPHPASRHIKRQEYISNLIQKIINHGK